MSLSDTGHDLRRMRRSLRLHDMSDPKEVQATLEQILIEAIHMQNVGNRRYQQKALDELKQVRRDMVAGQVRAGNTEKFVGLYGHVIDQIEGIVNDNAKANSAFEAGIGAIKNAIPSTDSLVAALMTANPLVGYGVKILRDIGRNRKENQERQREEAKQKLQVLKEEEAYIKAQLEAEGEDVEMKQDAKEVTKGQKREYTKGGIYREILTQIRDEIRELENLILSLGNEVENVDNTILKQIESDKENTVEQIDNANDIEKKKERDAKLTRMKEESPPEMPIIEKVEATSVRENKGGLGLLGMLGALRGGLIGGFIGLLSGIAGAMGTIMGGGMIKGIIGGITSLVKFVGVLGKGMLALGTKLLLPAAVLTAIYAFFDGFFNAAEFLNKSDVSIGERILVGVSNIIGVFGRIFDWLTEKMGFDFFDSTDLTKRVYDFFLSIPNKVMELFEFINNSIAEAFSTALDKVFGLANRITGIFSRLTQMIEEKINGIKQFASDLPLIGRWIGDGDKEDQQPIIERFSERQREGRFTDDSLSPLQMIQASGSDQSGLNSSSRAIIRAEQRATQPNVNLNNVVNAPVNAPTNIQNNTFGGSPTTYNPNRGFRQIQADYAR